MKFSVKTLVSIALLSSLSAVLFMLEIPIVMFYKLDLSNLPVLLGSFAFGPVAGLIIAFIKDLLGLLHSSTGGIGELADFLAVLPFALICGHMYRAHKTKKVALLSMLISTLAASVVSVLLNAYLLIPLLIPNNGLQVVANSASKIFPFISNGLQFLLLITLPFNLLKGFVVSGLTFVVYKKISVFLTKESAS